MTIIFENNFTLSYLYSNSDLMMKTMDGILEWVWLRFEENTFTEQGQGWKNDQH